MNFTREAPHFDQQTSPLDVHEENERASKSPLRLLPKITRVYEKHQKTSRCSTSFMKTPQNQTRANPPWNGPTIDQKSSGRESSLNNEKPDAPILQLRQLEPNPNAAKFYHTFANQK